MDRRLTISFLVFLCYSLIYGQTDPWDIFLTKVFYPYMDKSDCVFPFTYNGQTYNDCISDAYNSDLPWCSITSNYIGLFKYCNDYRQPQAKCLPSYTINGRNLTGCNLYSRTSLYKQCETGNPNVSTIYCVSQYTNKTGKPLIHTSNCDPKYTALSNFHSMCIGPSDYAIPVPITSTQQQALLDKHNYYRAQVTSRSMFKLYWDNDLATIAQAHANMCAFDHDLAGNRLSPSYGWLNGQNMIVAYDYMTPLDTLLDMMLGSEQPNFVYGTGCSGVANCLHYTQAMISQLTRVGCAQTHCLYPDRIEHFLVCNYIQSQYTNNYMIPYTASTVSLVDCPNNNDGQLCDCGNNICLYNQSQILDPGTCKCISQPSKRSIDTDEEVPLPMTGQKPFRFKPDSSSSDSDETAKRIMNILPQNDLAKRNFRKKLSLH